MPTIDDITKVLSNMDTDTYSAAVKYIYFLASEQGVKEESLLMNQKRFVEETAGKFDIDEDAITELRMRRSAYVELLDLN